MKRVNLGKPTATISENMSRKKLYVDSKHCDSIKKDVIKQLDVLDKSFEQLSSLLNKASYKKLFRDDYNAVALQCSKKSLSQSNNFKQIRNDLELKYNDDVKMALINNLNERISYLEDKLLGR